jgi:nesprin-1
MTSQLEALSKQYTDLCHTSKTLLTKCEDNVVTHQGYSDIYQQCEEQVTVLREKLTTCSDATGDRFAVRNKLEALQELTGQVSDCEIKMKQLGDSSSKTILTSSAPGKEMNRREMNVLQSDITSLASEVDEGKLSLQKALQQWQEFDDSHEALQHWLHRTEVQLKDTELKGTLEEKQEHVNKLKVSMIGSAYFICMYYVLHAYLLNDQIERVVLNLMSL